jgi:hypothetical protein
LSQKKVAHFEIFAQQASIFPPNYESKVYKRLLAKQFPCLPAANFSEAAQCRRETMKCLITFFGFAILLAQAAAAAREQPLFARVTVYWRGEGSGERASSTGARLREGHCAVDPGKIPFGSRVVFDDACCVAVDSGPAVLSRKAARLSGRNSRERNALVIDRFFETKRKAMAWAETHPHFMMVWIIPPGSASAEKKSQRPNADRKVADLPPPSIAPQQPNHMPPLPQTSRLSITSVAAANSPAGL